MNKSEKIKGKIELDISAKIMLSFFGVILLIGLGVNYFLINFLELYLKQKMIAPESIHDLITYYSLISIVGIVLFAVISTVLSFFVFRFIIKDIISLKNAMIEVARGNLSYPVIVNGRGAVAKMAIVFKEIVEGISKYKNEARLYSEKFEKGMSQQSSDLQKVLDSVADDKLALEDQRSAVLNILEDMHESQEELGDSKKHLEQKHYELKSLKELGDDLTSVIDVDEVVVLLKDYLKKASQACVITVMISNPSEAGDFQFKSFLNTPVGEDYLKFIKKEILVYMRKKSNNFDKSYLRLLDKIMPSLEGKRMDNDIKELPAKTILAPLVAGEKVFGAIHFSYCENKKSFAKKESDLISSLASTFSISVARLQAVDQYQHSKTKSLIKGLNDGVIMFTNEKNIVLTNPKATEYTGFSYISHSLDDFIKLFASLEIEEKINLAITEGLVSHIKDVKLLKKYYEMIVSPVKDSSGEIVGGSIIMHDITYMKEIDRVKTEFVSVASHQLRTPLTAIKLFTEMLIGEDVGKLNKDQKEYLDNVYNSTERMVRLVNDLLNVTRIESGRLRVSPQDTDISEFIKDVIIEAKPGAKMDNTIIRFRKVKIPKVPLDQNLFRQVIQNMISNAIRYSDPEKGEVQVAAKKDKDNFIISVSDNGIGIPKNMQKRIFEKFYRADNAIKAVTEGTGLGLYVSRMIVENSGGKIWFESVENKGTTFYVKMPLSGMRAIEGERGLAIS